MNETEAAGLSLRRRSVRSSGQRYRGVGLLFNGQIMQALVIAMLSSGTLWLVWVYGNGLRDPRYLDGWVLAGGMVLQLSFHIAIKAVRMSPKFILRWKGMHVFVGLLLVAAFASHCDFSLPDTAFEWALWTSFVLVTLSGIAVSYIAWSLRVKHGLDERLGYDRIPARREELARDVGDIAAKTDPASVSIGLPVPPHDAWVMDLYTNHLRDFFKGQRHVLAHLIGSRRPLKQLTDEIDDLARYVAKPGQERLAAMKELVIEKDRLDFARVHLGLSKALLFVHVPVTYALIVLAVLHAIVVYAFSSGAW